MLTVEEATVISIETSDDSIQLVTASRTSDGRRTKCINYAALNADVAIGDQVLLNTTAGTLNLGTGGSDFILANLSSPLRERPASSGHIIKWRYTPLQHSVLTLEENPMYKDEWEKDLAGMPVVVGQLHSQLLPAAAGLKQAGANRIGYVMTDSASLSMSLSNDVRVAKKHSLIAETYSAGQCSGGDHETVTVHSALLAAKHIHHLDAVVVCQGPGNAGTGTKYGFGGIELAQYIDVANQLGGRAFAIARCSSADLRPRHQGLSHHTRTALDLACTSCTLGLPQGFLINYAHTRHNVIFIDGCDEVIESLSKFGIVLTSMGRTYAEDALYFHAGAAAGIAAGKAI